MSTPIACSASRSGCLEVLGPESWQPSGRAPPRAAGRCARSTTGRRRPAPCGTGRSRPTRAGAGSATPRRRSSSATKCTVRNSRRLPRCTRPDGLAPDETVTISCRPRRRAGRRRRRRGSPSRGARRHSMHLSTRSATLPGHDQRVRRGLDPPGAVPLGSVDLAVGAAPELLAGHRHRRAAQVDHVVALGVPAGDQLGARTRTAPAARSTARPSRRPGRRPGRRTASARCRRRRWRRCRPRPSGSARRGRRPPRRRPRPGPG